MKKPPAASLLLVVISLTALSSTYFLPYWKYQFDNSLNQSVFLTVFKSLNFGTGFISSCFFMLKILVVLGMSIYFMLIISLFTKNTFQFFLSDLSICFLLFIIAMETIIGFLFKNKLGSSSINSVPYTSFYILVIAAICHLFFRKTFKIESS